jgi:Cu+-exporting ATPase
MTKRVTVSIKGMTCRSCEMLISEELKELPGISEIKIDYVAGQGVFLLDETKNTVTQALEAIERAGYQGIILDESVASIKENREDKSEKATDIRLKVKIESRVEAEGKVLEDGNGRPYFEGTISNSQSAEVDMPEAGTPSKDIVNQILRAVGNIQGIGGGFSRNGSNLPDQETIVPLVNPRVEGKIGISLDPQRRVSLSLFGMHCSSCANLIERALKKVPGVKQANVNFAAEKALVVFDENKAEISSLKQAVAKAGYKAEEVDPKDTEYERRKRDKEISSYFNKFIFGFI